MADIISIVRPWIGPLREKSFLAAVSLIIRMRPKIIVETGCYRGIDADGQSTRVLAFTAKILGCELHSFELNPDHIERAKALLEKEGLSATFHPGDAVANLRAFDTPIGFAYLDSYDYDCKNPEPSQKHHEQEALAVLPLMKPRSAILVDDCNIEGGGKVKLAEPVILNAGFRKVYNTYQMLFARP